MAIVHAFTGFDRVTRETKRAKRKATEAAIREARGKVIADSAETVPDEALDGNGFYNPVDSPPL